MVSLPTDAIPAAQFIVRRLYRAVEVDAGESFFAVSETEKMGDDKWFWNDDNAKVLELMSRPEVWRRFPQETGEILRFVRSMCHGPFIFRRVAAPRLDLVGTEDGITTYVHSLLRLRYDLTRGAIIAGVRFHDERNVDNLMLHGNYVEFTYRRRRHKVSVEPHRGVHRAERAGHLLRLHHANDVEFRAGWSTRRLGTIAYTYTFDARSMLFDAEAALDLDPAGEVSDVVLTIAHGGLSYCFFNNVVSDAELGGKPLFQAGRPAVRMLDAAGASYYAIRQGHISGDALALHSMPRDGQRLSGIEAGVALPGRLDRIVARYEFAGAQRGSRLVAAETKLLTAGGFYDRIADYAALLREAASARKTRSAAYDYSISYDYGVTINAFAKCLAAWADGAAPPEAAGSLDGLRDLLDTTLDRYFELYVDRHQERPNAVFSRELAFVILGAGTLHRITGDDRYRHRLEQLCDVLLDLEMRFDDPSGLPASSFLMRKDSPRAAYVDCHSAVMLALTQAARHVGDRRLPEVIESGLRSYGIETCRFSGGLVDTISALMIDEHGVRRTENAYWNFKAGLTMRFFAALRAAEDPVLRAVAERQRERIDLLETIMRQQIARSVTEHDDGVELRCSVLSAETNSESQPWTVLGLIGDTCD